MKKLEDIPKKDFFDAPEGYFDKLPGIIQSRVAAPAKPVWMSYFQGSLKYALPVLAIGVAAIFYFNKPDEASAESLIASIDSAQLVAYLEDSDVSSDDLIENISLDDDEANAINENAVNDLGLNDEELENLSNDFGVDY